MTWDSYFAQVVTSQASRCGYIIDGIATYDALPTAINTWKNHSITFTITSAKDVTFRMGYNKTANVGSTSSPILFVDNVKLLRSNQVDKTTLQGLLATATTMSGNPQPVGASTAYADLTTAINAAQLGYDNAGATLVEVVTQEGALTSAIAAVNSAITLEARTSAWTTLPYDATSVIVNPSFEVNGAAGWTNPGGFWSQGNTSFPFKAGNIYFEKWQGSGNWTNLKISQIIKDLPNGIYKLTAAALNNPETTGGAFVFANAEQVEVFTPNDYSVKVTVTNHELEIGYNVVLGGNYVATDNFRLSYLSDGSPYLYPNPTSLTFNPTNLVKTFVVSGGLLTENTVLVAPAGITLDKTTLTPTEVAAGTIITATFNNATAIVNGTIAITSGTLSKSVTVNASIDPVVVASVETLKLDDLNTTGSFTVTGSNLTGDITITAPTGITVNPTTIPMGTGIVTAVTVNVTYDGTTSNVSGNIVLTSGSVTDNIAVMATLNSDCFTPLYSTLTNLITDPYCNSLASYAGWGSNSVVSDYVYCGAKSIKITGKCGGSLDYNLTGKLQAGKTYRVKAMISTNGTGEAKIGISGVAASALLFPISTAVNEWLPLEITFTAPVDLTPTTSVNMFLNSCETQTATQSYIDNYELYDITSTITNVDNVLNHQSQNVYIQNNKIVADFNLDQSLNVEFSVFNAQGMLLSNTSSTLVSGNNHHVINANLPSGLYFVKITMNGKSATSRIIK